MARRTIDPVDRLRRFVAERGGQKPAATALGISQSYISDMLRGHRGMSDRIVNGIGLIRRVTVVYEEAAQ